MTDIDGALAHTAWTKVKSSAMRRPHLDCGCRNSPGLDTYLHLGCARIACKQHADDAHECQHYEPESPPREAAPLDDADTILRNVANLGAAGLPPIYAGQPMGEFVQNYVTWRRALDNNTRPAACCDLHGSNCEQGGEECCDRCTEIHHFDPGHGGVECSASVAPSPRWLDMTGPLAELPPNPFAYPREPSAEEIEANCRCHVVGVPPCSWCESGSEAEPQRMVGMCLLCSWRTFGTEEGVREATREHLDEMHPERDPGEEAARVESDEPVTLAVDVNRDGTSAVAMYDGSRYAVIDETHRVTRQELEAAVRAVTTAEARRIHERAFRRESLGEWPLDPSQDQPQRRSAAGSDLARSTEVNGVPARRPWWRIWS